MSLICPTVTATDSKTFDEQLELVTTFTKRVHLDFMDGDFAPTKSPSPNKVKLKSGIIYDIHLMYKSPLKQADKLIEIQPNLVIIHAEASLDIPLFATKMRESGIKTGVAILPETTVESVKYILPHVQHVLIFGGHLGYHGGMADLTQLPKVAQVKEYSKHVEIAWDGGANLNNVKQIMQAGVDVINVGGAIHRASKPKSVHSQLQSLVE